MSAILILGAGGFVGAHLEKLLKLRVNPQFPSIHFRYDRITRTAKALDTSKYSSGEDFKEMTLDALMWKFERVTVVNLMTNARGANLDNVKDANYSTPQQILRALIRQRSEISWIQVNSYFQFYYSLYGVDKDEYSKQKRLFSDELLDLSDDSIISVTQIYSPHLYGNFENKARITARLRDLVQGRLQKLSVSSGRQFLPLLDVRAFVSVICDLVGKDNNCSNISALYVRPEFTYELRQICNLATSVMQDGKERISFYKQKERPNEFYSSNFVPKNLLQYDSQLKFNFLDYLSSKD